MLDVVSRNPTIQEQIVRTENVRRLILRVALYAAPCVASGRVVVVMASGEVVGPPLPPPPDVEESAALNVATIAVQLVPGFRPKIAANDAVELTIAVSLAARDVPVSCCNMA